MAGLGQTRGLVESRLTQDLAAWPGVLVRLPRHILSGLAACGGKKSQGISNYVSTWTFLKVHITVAGG